MKKILIIAAVVLLAGGAFFVSRNAWTEASAQTAQQQDRKM